MNHRCPWLTVMTAAALFIAVSAPLHAAGFDHSHAALTGILKAHVVKGRVNYKALKAQPRELNAYLASLSAVKEPEFNDWSEAQQKTFLINVYNAFTLRLILDHYPLKSIKDIGWLFSGPWDQDIVSLFGKKTTLSYVEHKILRKRYNDPRIHFAIVCAARGCPVLRPEAYDAARLDEQLNEQGRLFLRDTTRNRVDAPKRVLYLSPIFKWFPGDFKKKSGSVQAFVAPYLLPGDQEALRRGRYRIRYTHYDWSLNELSKKR